MLDVTHPGPDYTLRWPRELFVQEGRALRSAEPLLLKGDWTGQVEWLLQEAFASVTPVTDFRNTNTKATWNDQTASRGAKLLPYLHQPPLFLQTLIEAARLLPEQSAPKPYYAARLGQPLAAGADSRPDPGAVRRDWRSAIASLQQRGYLAHVAPEPCVDGDRDDKEPLAALDDAIADRLGRRGIWTVQTPEDWDDATFYSLIEVFHDLVERPRSRYFHPYNNCGYHYSDFAFYPAQVLYRWTVNRILARHGVDLVLAKSGEDVGRLVHQPSDGRATLLESALATNDTTARSTVEHAISLFRGRAATREDKRSACVALAGLLEERRGLLKKRLFKRDEGALFQIANEFAVRHREAKQHSDYDEAYLDWLFWWYLATFDLTNKLMTRTEIT